MSDIGTTIILDTKLRRPRFASNTVMRPRVLDLLGEAAGKSVLLVSAPAGYGKTTAVNLWVESRPSPCAWLSVDEHDSELRDFVAYLTAAVRTAYPNSCHNMSAVLAGPSTIGPILLSDIFLRELEELGGGLILVVDDYHLVHGLDIRSFMVRIVSRLPANVQLVLLTRADPEIGLERLRGRGLLSDLRSEAIRFTRDEAAEMLSGLIGEAVAQEVTDLLLERTEGWPLGLQMAGMAMRGEVNQIGFAQRFARSSHRSVTDYLLNEVLGTLDEERRRLLLRCAIPDRFCAPLCDVLAEGTSLQGQGQTLIDLAWQVNWFLVALDEEGVWYRFHHLFRDLLRQRLRRLESEDTIAHLHWHASVWFEQEHLLEESVTHALQAGEVDRAASLIEGNIETALNQEDWRLLERWLHLLPDEVMERPSLLVVQAFLAWFGHNQPGIDASLDAAEAGLASNTISYSSQQTSTIRAHIHQMRANHYSKRDAAVRLDHAEQALELLGSDAQFCRGQAELFRATALHHLGRTDEALAYLSDRIQSPHGQSDTRTLRLLLGILNIHYAQSDLASIDSLGKTMLQIAEARGNIISTGWILFGLGWVHYQRNNLDLAAERFLQGIDHRFGITIRATIDCYTGLALAQQACGRFDEVANTAAEMRRFIANSGRANILPLADALDLHLTLAREEHTGAQSLWHPPPGLSFDPEAQLAADSMIVPVLTSIRAHVALGRLESMEEAWSSLQQCRDFAVRTNSRRRLIEIGVLEARHHSVQGDTESALRALRESVLLAETGGALRLIADNAFGLNACLRQLQETGVAPTYLKQVCDVLAEQERSMSALADKAGALAGASLTSSLSDTAVPDLTLREFQVLRLVAQGLTNKEIAAELTVSTNTVKMHTSNIYQKMNVPNRRSAVRTAVELGLIPSDR